MAGISTAEESAESGAVLVGPPPPFDPELLPAMAAMAQTDGPAFTLEMIPAIRRAPSAFPVPTLEDLRRGGAFEVTERLVPGPAGAPDVSLLIGRPTGVPGPGAVPVLHPRRRDDARRQPQRRVPPGRSRTPRSSARPWCRWSTGSRRRRRTRDRSKTATRA